MRKGGFYCEVAHLWPVARGGKSLRLNLLVLCPNHHKMFDHGDLEITENTRSIAAGKLNGEEFRIVP